MSERSKVSSLPPSSPSDKDQWLRKVAASLAGEYALALLWPISTVIYAWLPPLVATLVGAVLLWPLGCYIVFSACPKRMQPRVSPAFILVDGFYLERAPQPGEARYERRMQQHSRLYSVEGPVLALMRLTLHWLGAFSGYYLLRLTFGDELRLAVEQGLGAVWSFLGSGTGLSEGRAMYMFLLHVMTQAAIGMHQMRFFSLSLHSQTHKESVYFKGAMISSLVYPWAAPHFSPGSFLWVTHAVGLSSLTLMTASVLSCLVSAVISVFLYEGTVGRSASRQRIEHSPPPAQTTTRPVIRAVRVTANTSTETMTTTTEAKNQLTEINELD